MSRPFLRRGLLALTLVLVGPASAGAAPNNNNSAKLTQAVTVAGIYEHLNAFQAQATANGGNRFAGLPGHDASAQYVYDRARAAGYDVRFQEFEYEAFEDQSVLTRLAPAPQKSYTRGFFQEFVGSNQAPEGTVTDTEVYAVDIMNPPLGDSTSGCEDDDFDDFVAGSIALVQRGTCNFVVKSVNAEEAGASAVIIMNEGNAGRTELDFNPGVAGTNIPVVATSSAVGFELSNGVNDGLTGTRLNLTVDFFSETLTTRNVIADSPRGAGDNVVVVGAHLDSVLDGPGINDNGSGSGTILEIAEQMTKVKPRNQVRFIWFSAEESGLIGSNFYVASLSAAERANIAAMLNFDMVASPNFARFVYDGSDPDAPAGSGAIEDLFNSYFASRGLAFEPTPFDGRSDYGPFIAAGVDIPAGGLFTGAEVPKTSAQVLLYGGTAGIPFDPCYHQACDTIANINDTALDQMSDAAAHATITLAQSTAAVNGKRGKGNFKPKPAPETPIAL
ncbi:MAG: M28 family peptidase [Solirubrobacteraceae bacterium]|nr:M28 family peptidase [Solirubrobacteraceae bacterium]